MSKRVSNKIVYMNFIGCIIVLFYHSSGYKYFEMSGFVGEMGVFLIDRLLQKWMHFGVTIFFLLSGFLFFHDIHETKSIELSYFCGKWVRRAKSLLVPFFFWNIFWMIINIVMCKIPFIESHMVEFQRFDPTLENILRGIFLAKYNGVFWYILYLIPLFILTPIFYFLMKKRISGVIWLIAVFSLSWKNIPYFNRSDMCTFFAYNLGIFLALHGEKLIEKISGKSLKILAMIFLMVSFLFQPAIYINLYAKYVIAFMCIVCIWLLLDILDMEKAPKWYYRISFFVYAFHATTQQCINKVFAILLPNEGIVSPFGALINTFGGVFLTYALAVLIAGFMKKHMIKTWKMICGGRG